MTAKPANLTRSQNNELVNQETCQQLQYSATVARLIVQINFKVCEVLIQFTFKKIS